MVALAYILVFGVGSIVGMAVLSYAVAWPLGAIERSARKIHVTVTVLAALFAVGIGVNVMRSTAALAWVGA
ncbi:hypothetical protein HY26_17545 [Hyphomonas sp. GM-8P]|nr:hypothetical protein HY26_17545 [Hyphomonas sp. GM-8P]